MGSKTYILLTVGITLFIIDGYDITMLLEDNIELVEFLRIRQRLLAEEGRVISIQPITKIM